MRNYKAKVIRVVDGDTVDMEFDLGFYVTTRVRTRLIGVDTPERGQPDFSMAKDMLTDLLRINTDQDGYVEVECHKTGKYGRWLVNIPNVNYTLANIWPYQ